MFSIRAGRAKLYLDREQLADLVSQGVRQLAEPRNGVYPREPRSVGHARAT